MKWLALLLLTACAHSAQPTLYTLVVREGQARPQVLGVIEVRTPHVAGYLDRHDLVLRVAAQRLELARNAQWAEPLDAMIARVLASDLAQRLPSVQVLSEGGEVRTEPTLRLEIDVRSFQFDDAGELVLDALVAIRRPTLPDAIALERVSLARSTVHSADALVDGMSALLGELSEHAIALIARLPPM